MRNQTIKSQIRAPELLFFFLFVLLFHASSAQCPSGTFQNMDGDCQACFQDCTECNGPNHNNCTVCTGIMALTTHGTCEQWCTLFSTRVGNVCVPCAVENCRQCSGPGPNECNGCTSPLYVYQGAACLESCPDGSYPGYGRCKDCHSTCATCTGGESFSCTTCKESYLYFRGRCLETCYDGLFEFQQKCEFCNEECSLCEGQANNCTACKDESKLVQAGQCVDSCSSGYFQTGRKCEACVENCDQCSNTTTCQKCSAGYFFHNGACVAECPMGTYTDQQNAICTDCPAQCNKCDKNLSCLNCRGGFGVNNGQCVVCGLNQFLNPLSNTCEDCASECASCSESFNNCTSCSLSSNYLYKNRCEGNCPPRTFPSQNTCVSCPDNCAQCNQNGQCLKCEASLLQEGVCVALCAEGYYEWENSCKRCVGQISQISSFLQKDVVVKTCPAVPYTKSQDLGYYDYLEAKYASLKNSERPLFQSEELLAITTKVLLASVDQSFVYTKKNFTVARQLATSQELTLTEGSGQLPLVSLATKPDPKLDAVIIALWTDGFFHLDLTRNPVIQLHFVHNGEVQDSKTQINNPLQLHFVYSANPPEELEVVEWDESTQQWSESTISTIKSTSTNFTIQLSNGGIYAVQRAQATNSSSKFVLHYGIGAYALGLLLFASLFDCAVVCRHRGEFYPHRRVKLIPNKCTQLYSFSILYNLPLLNICCYRSVKMHAIYRALWLSNMLSIVLTIIICVVHTDVQLTSDPVANRLAVASILGVCFIPHSLLHRCMVEWKVVSRDTSSTDTVHALHRGSDWKLFEMSTTERQCTSPKSSKRQRKLSFQDLKGEEVSNGLGIATFFLFTLLIHGVSTLFAYIWKEALQEQLESIILSFALSIAIGLLYALIKQALATIVSLHCRRSKCMYALFVDVLTKMVWVHQNPAVNCGIVAVSCSERRS